MKPIEFIPDRRRPTVRREERRTVLRAPLLPKHEGHWLESRLVFALAVGATILSMGILIGFIVGFLLEVYR